MSSYYLVIITDPNRKALHVYCTEDRAELLDAINERERAFGLSTTNTLSHRRIVYQEEFCHSFEGLARYQLIKHFTRMQLERLVRKHNPNWLNLYSSPSTNLYVHINGRNGKAIA